MADALWILFGGHTYYPEGGEGDMLASFQAADFGEAKAISAEVIASDRADWWELVRVSVERRDEFHVMWTWWKEDDGSVKGERGKGSHG